MTMRWLKVMLLSMTTAMTAHGLVAKSELGKMPDGTAVDLYTLKSDGIEASIMTYGARVVSIKTADRAGTRSCRETMALSQPASPRHVSRMVLGRRLSVSREMKLRWRGSGDRERSRRAGPSPPRPAEPAATLRAALAQREQGQLDHQEHRRAEHVIPPRRVGRL